MPYKDPKKRKENKKKRDAKYDAKRAGRTRNFTCIMYPEDLPENWQELMDEQHLKWVESPMHDKDLNPDGTPKKTHHHILIIFEVVKTVKQVEKLLKDIFGEAETGSIIGVATPQTVSDRCSLVRYFAHLDHPSKAQYDVNDIIGHGGADVMELMRYSQSETLEMMKDIEKYIEEHEITELSELSRRIRDTNPEWYMILTTRNTYWFANFIRAFRHEKQKKEEIQNAVAKAIENGQAKVDENGEIAVDE